MCVLCTCVCRFYETDSSIKIGLMDAFAKLAVHPDSLPDIIFASIGRTVWKVGTEETGSCCCCNTLVLLLTASRYELHSLSKALS